MSEISSEIVTHMFHIEKQYFNVAIIPKLLTVLCIVAKITRLDFMNLDVT